MRLPGRQLTKAERDFKLEKLRLKYAHKDRRLAARVETARSMRVPVAFLCAGLPVWLASSFAGTTTNFSAEVSLTIAVSGAGVLGWLFEHFRGRSDRKELTRLREKVDEIDAASGLGRNAVQPGTTGTKGGET